jgi:hypothetical protein
MKADANSVARRCEAHSAFTHRTHCGIGLGGTRATRWCSPCQPIFCVSLVAGILVMLATGRRDGAILIVLTATMAVVSRASRAPAVAQVLFVALLTVASYVIAFGGVRSAALDSAVAHFVLPAAAAPLLLGAALRSGVVAWPRSGRHGADLALHSRPRRADHRRRSGVGARRVRV